MSEWIESTTAGLRRVWTLHVAEHVKITLTMDGVEYFAQCHVGHMPILGKTFKGTYIGTDATLPLETAQATALGKSYDEVAEVLHKLEQAMHEHDHEVEPLVPDGALDHRGRP
jgi:hypothetical protein